MEQIINEARHRSGARRAAIVWSTLSGVAVWAGLRWFDRRRRQVQAAAAEALHEQRALNRQLQRANSQLALLSDVNRHIADSATLDEILHAALSFPQRLVPARAASLWLIDPSGAIEARTSGVATDELARLRSQCKLPTAIEIGRSPQVIAAPSATLPSCVLVPLHDGQTLVGWIELYPQQPATLAPDELALLETIGSEIAEAIVSARRRSQEERAIYELERAISEERARISRDIHDGITQTLAFRRMRIDLWLDWLDTDREQLRAELIESKQLLREQIQDLRRAIFALRPLQFDELGFVGGLHRYIDEFASQHSWATQVDVSGAPSALTPEQEAIVFRVIQEALTNVAKHAQASWIEVTLLRRDDGLCIAVTDDGVGFDPYGQGERDRFGLRQMRERVTAVQGRFRIRSAPGAGTTIEAWVPLGNTQGVEHEQRAGVASG